MVVGMLGRLLERSTSWLCFSTPRPPEQADPKLTPAAGAGAAVGSDEDAARETSCLSISVYSAVVIAAVCVFLVLGRDYIKYLLLSLEETNLVMSFAVFSFMFTVVSFPMTWGYILLNIAAGYLYGLLLGSLVVMSCALLGLATAHCLIRSCLTGFVKRRLTNSSVRAIMNVVESDHGFKVVVLSRLTPIPFGLQNALYAVSEIGFGRYMGASAVGMMPAQGMHCYLGSTLRSMEEVVSHSANSSTAAIVFTLQLSMILVLLLYVVRRARIELDRAVTDLNSPHKSVSTATTDNDNFLTPDEVKVIIN